MFRIITQLTHNEGVDEDDVEHAAGAEVGPQCLLHEVLLHDVGLSLQCVVTAVGEGVTLPQERRQEPVE